MEILQYTIKKIPFLYLSCSWLLFLDSKTTKVRKREESFEFQIYEIKNTESNNSLKIEYIKHDVSRIHFRRARAPRREGETHHAARQRHQQNYTQQTVRRGSWRPSSCAPAGMRRRRSEAAEAPCCTSTKLTKT